MKTSLRVIHFASVIGLASLAAVGPAKGAFDLNHYILGCGDYCSSVARPLAFSANIDATFTGSWYDPAQSGHGLSIEILPDNRLLLFWFTFNPDGTQQTWLVGSGTYTGNVATIDSAVMPAGGRWIPNFDSTKIIENAWGNLTLTFDDSGHGKIEFKSVFGYGTGRMNLTRLTRPAGITTTALSASGKAWVRTENLNSFRAGHTATALADGRVLVAGGWSDPVDFMTVSAELYDPVDGTWTPTGAMTVKRSGHTATALPDGRVLIAGGLAHPDDVLVVEVVGPADLYDPNTDRWTATGSLNAPRTGFTATLLDTGKVLVTGGYDGGALASAELYDPEAGTWSFTGNLREARYAHTATKLPNGKVLVTGGALDDFRGTATTELYDPVAGTWTTAAPLHGARDSHTATALQNGNVLVIGGTPYPDSPFVDTQLYDAATASWADANSPSPGRILHSATRLSDGKVLITGGYDSYWGSQSHPGLASAELFDPVTGTWSDGGRFDVSQGIYHTATLLRNGNVLIAGGVGEHYDMSNASSIYAYVPVSAGAGMTGAWYDPAQSGHGLVVEALAGNRMLATWFAFNPAGTQQSWFLGVGSVSGNTATVTPVVQPTGGRFIPNFDPSGLVNNAWGTLTFTFIDCDHGNVDFASTAGYGTGSMNLTRLTRPAGVTCP